MAEAEKLSAVGTSLWWLSPAKDDDDESGAELARNVKRVCVNLETNSIPRRWRNYCYYRYFTGEPYSAQFAYGMARRPANFVGYYGSFEFEPATYNLIGVTSDVYVNRLLSHKSFVTMTPEHGNYDQRQLSKDIEGWVEGGFEDTGYWKERLGMGINSLCYGSGYVNWDKQDNGKLGPESWDPNELLFPDYDDPNPRWFMRRKWVSREDMMDLYGKKDPKAAAAIMREKSYPAFWFGDSDLDCGDVIPLIYAQRARHVDGSDGRECLVIGDYTIYDRPYKDEEISPIRFDFHQKPSSCVGQGIPALLLPLQQAIDEYLDFTQESDKRAGMGKWLISDASGVNVDSLGDTIAAEVVYTAGTAEPKYVAPEPIGQYALERIKFFIEMGMKRVHISDLAIQGEQPRALTSAIALERWSQIDDMNFLELIGRLEEVDRKSALRLIRLGKEHKPSYTAPGREIQIIDWEKLVITDGTPKGIRAYNTGRFGQSISAKLQELSALLAQGSIDKDTYNKYLQVPDMGDLLDKLNAPMTGADKQIQALLKPKAKYVPPLPFLNLTYAKQAVEAIYIIESDLGTPQDRLDNLLLWRAAVMEMISERNTPDKATGVGGSATPAAPAIPEFGGSANGNPAFAPSPMPIQPADTSAVSGALQ
jgi:hypothetical protein